jgi:hypothetical protein
MPEQEGKFGCFPTIHANIIPSMSLWAGQNATIHEHPSGEVVIPGADTFALDGISLAGERPLL